MDLGRIPPHPRPHRTSHTHIAHISHINTSHTHITFTHITHISHISHITHLIHTDALESSHPIEVDVANSAEVNEIFDAISYCKGASIIRMLVITLGEHDFREVCVCVWYFVM